MNNLPAVVEDEGNPLDRFGQGVVLALVVLPPLGLIIGISEMWEKLDWFYILLLLFSLTIRNVGITVGFHRLFTHESFKAKPVVEFVFGILGSMAYQGRMIVWCSNHSEHHQHSDRDGDPHSPWRFGTSPWALFKGFWFAHFGWLFSAGRLIENNCSRRLAGNKVTAFVDRHTLLWMVLSALMPVGIGYLYETSWLGAWRGLLWGWLIAIFFLQHNTWSINSVCHIWGRKTFKSGDQSKDNLFFTITALGEGAHNGHHAFSWSAVHAIRHGWLDVSYQIIRLLEKCKLAWDVRVPTEAQIQTKLVK